MLLEESGIDAEVAEARGYRTVAKKVELEKLGFGRAQRNVPALLMPVHSPSGEVMLYQSRPDEPRIKDGKAIKYEVPPPSRSSRSLGRSQSAGTSPIPAGARSRESGPTCTPAGR